jgi:uncharacterized protein (TIGR02099 family)
LSLWLAFALVWGGLHGWIVPRIGQWRPLLEQQATRLVGVPVRIGSISALSQGLLPSFEMRDVTLLDAQGRAALHLPRVVGTLSPGSLWNLGFEQLFIDQPELDIRRTAQGRILVAGLDLGAQGGGSAEDWLFSQTEFFIRKGTLRWTDELRRAPPLALRDVDLVLRNGAHRHGLRLDATPPPQWGQRFSLRALFRQPLLSTRSSHWQDWDGQVYADFAQVDVSHLQQYADLGVTVSQGQGALRLWGEMARGQLVAVTADAALARVGTRLGSDLVPLELEQVHGRVNWRSLSGGFELATEGLQFQTRDGLHWPGGNVLVSYTPGEGRLPAQGDLRADRLDLLALSQIANRLPLGAPTHAALLAYRPKGLVERIQAHWQGRPDAMEKFSARGLVSGLEIAAQAAPGGPAAQPGTPGLRGASLEFEMTQAGGKARLDMAQGALEFPGIFEEPVITLDQLGADLQWQIDKAQVAVQVTNGKFSNVDAQGELQAQWHSADPAKSSGHSRFPGVLELQGSLSRAEAARVYRYLPIVLAQEARDYVRHAVLQGKTQSVKFRVKGDLADMPFANPRLGEFHIAAQVQNATLAFIPKALQAKDEPLWPVLTQLGGELIFDRASLQIKGASASVLQAPGFSLFKAEAQIPDLTQPTLAVSTEARGPLPELLRVLTNSPLSAMLGHALDKAVASGGADYRLRLSLPLQNLDKSKVQGSVTLAGNDLHIVPDSPVLTRARGVIHYTESSFNLAGAQARMLGGEARIEGGLRPGAAIAGSRENILLLRAQGTVSAEGLRGARELGLVSRLAQDASGSTAYSATFGLRQGVPELSISSNLQGLALGLPAPLNKAAETALPLRYETALLRDNGGAEPGRLQDRMTLELGRIASFNGVRDVSGSQPRLLHGGIGIGLPAGESAPAPTEGVVANVILNSVDLNAWDALLSRLLSPRAGDSAAAPRALSGSDAVLGYLPTILAVRARTLSYGGYQINNVVLGGSREGLNWRANLHADELGGYLEYRQPSDSNSGRVYARLNHLKIAPSAVKQVENLLDEQPRAIPALDIVVDELELRGKKLGRVEIEAVNRIGGAAREWRLNKLNLINPEGNLTASGNWAAQGSSAPTGTARRRTTMDFKLDVADAGGLLARLGMKDVVLRGRGKLEGHVAWLGSPLTPDYPSMDGQFNVNVETGQFLQVEPGAAKLLGVLSLQSLPRRLTLDFRDVFSTGFAFDFIRGDVQIANGIATTNNLQMKGVNAAVLMEGRADIARETQNLKVVVVPEINAGTASLVATIINPAVGLGSFLAQMFLRRPLIEAATQELHIDGTWTDYKVTKVEHHAQEPVKP